MKLAYLISRFPAVSHTFVRREVEALGRRGLEVVPISVWRPGEEEISSEADRVDRDRTIYLMPARPLDVVACHLRSVARRPRSYAGAFREALRHRRPGVRAAVWAVFHFAEAMLLARELERNRIGHLHSHFANSAATVGLVAARYLGIGWSVTLHGRADLDPPAGELLGSKLARASFVACASHFMRSQALRRVEPALWPRIFVSRCGVEIAKLPPPVHPRAPQGGIPPRVVCVGRLSPEKGHVGLLDAFGRLSDSDGALLELIGDGPERGRIQRCVEEKGLDDRVLLRGNLPEAQVLERVSSATVFALSSLMEGLPVSLMEAMALGVPVVAPWIAGIPELVRDEETGLLYPPGCWESLAACMERLLKDGSLRERLARAGRWAVEREFDVDSAISPLVERYRALGVGPDPRGGPQ